MAVIMNWSQEIKLCACLEFIAFPASLDSFFLTALSHLAEWRSTARATALVTAKTNHGTEHFIAFIIIRECLAETLRSHEISEFFIL